ncbi:MAG: tRNA (adenosine(37)-N6)-threonylcarbamoyltransferase complex dimerization subunit type 1 TsaB [Sphaerochaetaceae bacterium]|nr:tRNA (adenosine(37)-N6)-threonylcarbamoyltransferase complex dimerization subunit type 1 TsaB [Sphaerochaetaceae bacterium]
MNVLAIETSTDILHLALQAEQNYIAQTKTIGRHFSEELIVRIHTICSEGKIRLQDLDLLVCARGPGSFTGLRVGMATAKGIALAASIPMVSISTLEILQFPLQHTSMPLLCILDAKKKRYYCALFSHGERLSPDLDATVSTIIEKVAPYPEILVTGPEATKVISKLRDEVTKRTIQTKFYLDPLQYRDYGESMILLGKNLFMAQGPDAPNSGPTYIRRSDAEVSLEVHNAKTQTEEVSHE